MVNIRQRFDIHGGGMDLIFPHHEAKWLKHLRWCNPEFLDANMVTIDGKKMGNHWGTL